MTYRRQYDRSRRKRLLRGRGGQIEVLWGKATVRTPMARQATPTTSSVRALSMSISDHREHGERLSAVSGYWTSHRRSDASVAANALEEVVSIDFTNINVSGQRPEAHVSAEEPVPTVVVRSLASVQAGLARFAQLAGQRRHRCGGPPQTSGTRSWGNSSASA